MSDNDPDTSAQRWARLRFAIVGPLLAAPPKRGALREELESLARRTWKHPTRGTPLTFGVSTLERWYYRAKNETRDPVAALRRAPRKDAGTHALSDPLSFSPVVR